MFLKPQEPTHLDKEIDRLTLELNTWHPTSDEYVEIMDRLTKLSKIREDQKSDPISKDTLLIVGANLLGVLLIISTEREHVITTKAMSMLARPKN